MEELEECVSLGESNKITIKKTKIQKKVSSGERSIGKYDSIYDNSKNLNDISKVSKEFEAIRDSKCVGPKFNKRNRMSKRMTMDDDKVEFIKNGRDLKRRNTFSQIQLKRGISRMIDHGNGNLWEETENGKVTCRNNKNDKIGRIDLLENIGLDLEDWDG